MRNKNLINHRAKKSLGQNFLKSVHFAYDLVSYSDIDSVDTIVEVGPGRGMITKILLEKAKHVIGVEKDDNLHELLKDKFKSEISSKKLTLVHGDILEFNPKDYNLKNIDYKVVGSIPYYITGFFIRKFLTEKIQPKSIGIIIQKEVARRIMARDGKESILSVSVKVFGTPSSPKVIKAREFSPRPKVDSAILIIKNISRDFFENINEKEFFSIMKRGFSSKRKKLIGNLKQFAPKEELEMIFEKNNISLNARAENISTKEWTLIMEGIL